MPEVLGAVKRAVDRGSGGGRFLLTGSVAPGSPANHWPGTGRVVDLHVYGLTEREIVGHSPVDPFLELAQADIDALPTPADPPDLLGYVELALRGGFPDGPTSPQTPDAPGLTATSINSSQRTPRTWTALETLPV